MSTGHQVSRRHGRLVSGASFNMDTATRLNMWINSLSPWFHRCMGVCISWQDSNTEPFARSRVEMEENISPPVGFCSKQTRDGRKYSASTGIRTHNLLLEAERGKNIPPPAGFEPTTLRARQRWKNIRPSAVLKPKIAINRASETRGDDRLLTGSNGKGKQATEVDRFTKSNTNTTPWFFCNTDFITST